MISSQKLNRRTRISFDRAKEILKKIFPILIFIPIIIIANILLTIKKINCTLNNEICPQEIQIVTNKLLSSNSLFINQKELLIFTKAIFPIEKMKISYKTFNTININFFGSSPYIQTNLYLVNTLPVLSMDNAPSSTDSAGWWIKPTVELKDFVSSKEKLGFNFWENGSMTPIASASANINYIFSEKPSPEKVISIYKMTKLVEKYLEFSQIYIVNHRIFLSRSEQPDIIIGVPFDEGSLVSALQSINYLSTIKKDTKVIDLSFKNPIIR